LDAHSFSSSNTNVSNRIIPLSFNLSSTVNHIKGEKVTLTIQNETIDLDNVNQLYPAAIIKYADGTVTPISLEWFDKMANQDVNLLHYAICIHYKEETKPPSFFTYENRQKIEDGIADIAKQLDSSN